MSEDLREALLEEESYDDPLINALDNNHTTNHSPNHSHTNDSHVINTPESAIRRFVPSMATRAWVTVTVLTAVNLVNYMDRFSVAGVLPAIESFYHISESQSGLLTTSFILSYMCVSLLFGYLGDRFNRKLMLVMGIVFWGTVSLASSFIGPEHFYTFLLLRALIGVGEASYSTIAPTIMADLFAGAARTRALSFFYFAIPVGGGLGYIVASKVAEFMGSWQWALRVTPVLCLLLSLCVLLLVYEPSRGASDHSSYLQSSPWKQDVLYLLKHKSFMLITLAFTCVSFVTGALALWTPKYLYLSILVQAHTANSANVASIFGVITCTSGVIGVLAGTCVAGFLRRYTTCCDPLVCAFGLVASAPFLFMALYLAPFNTPLTYVLIFVSETLLFLNWALVSDMLMYVVLPTRRSAAASLQILMSHALGDAGSPPLIGMISDALNTAPKDYRALDHMSNLKSLQSALYINCFVAVLGGAFFLLASFHVHHDRQTTLKLIRADYLNEDEDNEDGNLVQP